MFCSQSPSHNYHRETTTIFYVFYCNRLTSPSPLPHDYYYQHQIIRTTTKQMRQSSLERSTKWTVTFTFFSSFFLQFIIKNAIKQITCAQYKFRLYLWIYIYWLEIDVDLSKLLDKLCEDFLGRSPCHNLICRKLYLMY